MKDWTAKDWIGLTIAAGLILWGVILMVGIMVRGGSISEKGSEIFTLIAGGLATALGFYFGRNGAPK